MKDRIYTFLTLITIIVIICVATVVYYNVSKFEAITWQSKALIEQAKPLIIEAEGERAIDYAVANSVYTQSAIAFIAIAFPYLVILLIAFNWLLKNGVMLYEKLRSAKHNSTNN